jgi:hypothetical protein
MEGQYTPNQRLVGNFKTQCTAALYNQARNREKAKQK